MRRDQANILFIAVDDLRPQLGCYGYSEMVTPNMDRLAASSVLFERNLCQVPICMASRASFYTGIRPDRHRIYSCEPVGKLLPNAVTLNRFFESRGYSIHGAGKIYHYPSDNREQYRDGYAEPTHKMFGRGYVNPETWEQVKALDDRWLKEKGIPADGRGPAFEVGDAADEAHRDGASALWAEKQLGGLSRRDGDVAPFLLSVGFTKPHLPYSVPKKYWDLYDRSAIPLRSHIPMPKDVPDFTSSYNFGELRNYHGIPPGHEPLSDDLQRTLIHGYYASVSFLDTQIGRVLDALEQSGLADSTIVVLCADHGFQLGEHGLFCKHTAFRESCHVPLMIRAPGVTPVDGGRVRGLSENIDIFPTLCALCGYDVPTQCDGESRVDWLQKPESGGKDAAFTFWSPVHRTDPERAVLGYSVVTETHRYTEWIRVQSGECLGTELYDLRDDPAETINATGNPKQAQTRSALAQRLRDLA